MSKQSKLEQLEQQAAEAKAAMDAHLAKCNALGEEARQLRARLRDPVLPALERLRANARLREIGGQLDKLNVEGAPLSQKQARAEAALFEAKRRLAEAERVLGVVKDPPPWHEVSPAVNRQHERRAKRVIRELTGR